MAILILSLPWEGSVNRLGDAALVSLILVKKGSSSSLKSFAYFTLEIYLSEDICRNYEGLPITHFLSDFAMSKSSNNSRFATFEGMRFAEAERSPLGLGIPWNS